jgi:hypothetical protein
MRLRPGGSYGAKEAPMDTLFDVIALAFVATVLAVVVFALFELTPFARRSNPLRDATGRRMWESPHLD